MHYKNIPFSPPDITEVEIDKVIDTMRSGWLTTGPKTKELERKIAKYTGASKAVCLNSATSAMEMTLRILGIGPGDEVITTAYTYTASASVIHHVGATIKLIDTYPDSYEMNYDQLRDAINEKTKAVIPVDIAGRMCDYDTILSIVKEKKGLFKPTNELQELYSRVIVVADGAHAFGAVRKGEICGTVADFTCFSFHAVKNLTTSEGGAVLWKEKIGLDNEWLYNQYMLFSLHGQSKDALEKTQKGSWEYDIVYPGYKCNMTDISASIGLIQLERYNELINKRKEIIKIYDEELKNIDVEIFNHYSDEHKSSGHLYLTRIPGITEEERNKIIIKMADLGIACNVHYKPLPMHTAYRNLGFNIKNFPDAYNQYKNQITLPLHTMLSKDDVMYVIENFKQVVGDMTSTSTK